MALIVDISDLLPSHGGRVVGAARRLWLAQREVERRTLERGGVPTALVSPEGGAGPALLTLRRRLEGLGRKVEA